MTNFVQGLTGAPQRVRNEADQTWLDIFPDTTRELSKHESEFGIIPPTTIEGDRRDALTARWRAIGNQSPSYIQLILQTAGFDVYVHEVIPTQNPNNFLSTIFITVSGEPDAKAGEPGKVAGKLGGEVLVNGIQYTTLPKFKDAAGEPGSISGEPGVVCGELVGTQYFPITYPIPTDPNTWPHFWYIGGQIFPNSATVDAARETEFKSLTLKLKPVHTWVGLLINFS